MHDRIRYAATARNLVRASENKIHDDEVARRLGFTGGLVAGVDVIACVCHPPVARWGRAWLERGRIACRLLKPVYDGQELQIAAEFSADAADITADCAGVRVAVASVALGESRLPPPLAGLAELPLPAHRPAADATSLAAGTWLGTVRAQIGRAAGDEYLVALGEPAPLYRTEGLVHPGQILRLCNSALKENVVLGPWLHTASEMENYAVARAGEELSCRARVTDNFERKGHRFVELDAWVISGGERIVCRVRHTAIYAPRASGGSA